MTESPFIEGTTLQFAWDATSLDALKKCPRFYYYTIVEGWRKRDESVHLTFGINFHSGLEEYDKLKALGQSHDDAVDGALDRILRDTYGWESDHTAKNRINLIRSVLWYLEEYRDDPAKTLILANGKPAVELSFRMDSGLTAPNGKPYLLSGHMDRMVQFGSEQYVMDRKTSGSTISSYFFKQFNPHTQMSLYTLAGKIVYGTKVAGVIIDGAQIAVGFTAFARGMTMRTEDQLEEFHANIAEWLRLAEHFAERESYPMNEHSCGDYGGCPFRDVCGQDRRVRQHFLETEFEVRKWNPLQAR